MESELNKKVKELRQKIGLTQVQFAELMNITQSYLSAIESEKREVSLSLIMKIRDEFEISTEDFLYGNISDCDITTSDERKIRLKSLREKSRSLPEGWLNEDLDTMLYRHAQFTHRIIDSNDLEDISDVLLGFEYSLYICHEIVRGYSINNLTSEDFALYGKKVISQKELSSKYQEAISITKELYEIIKPFNDTIEQLYDQIQNFDKEHNKTFYLGDD